ncbi:hypothetical protein [Qipengyuania vesicularis]|uniref:hypothetical protein n=1 Tax=Qipengyuania vesicularis TaxID=2867232 RepID=UPI001C86A695|nr:hypothetical protein [Qipengyuania vesicularis]MBX7527507.1 hypothetical protein [Qipengyuania vesicularis]
MIDRYVLVPCGMAALVIGAGPLAAQDTGADPYGECARISEDAARLACFDATYVRESALASQRVEEEKEATEDSFGFNENELRQREAERAAEVAASAPQSAEVPGAVAAAQQPEPAFEGIRATITEVLTDRRGERVIMLSNGQIWRTTAVKSYRGSVREGWVVEITEGTMGGYRMKFEDRRGFLGVRRVR